MTEFQVNGRQYRADRMNAMTQFHVVRRLARILPAMKGLAAVLPSMKHGDLDTMAEALAPVVEAISSMSDEDSEYVLGSCLSLVSRQQPEGGWARLWSSAASRPMFDDLTMPEMLQIAVHVLMGSIGPF